MNPGNNVKAEQSDELNSVVLILIKTAPTTPERWDREDWIESLRGTKDYGLRTERGKIGLVK